MALSNKIGFFIILLVCGMILEGKNGNAETICTLECNTKAVYIRCLPDNKKTKIGSGGCTNCCSTCFAVYKIIVTMDDALNKLLGVLKNIFYGRVEFHDGVCIAYDHVDEILKTLHLFRHLLDLSYSDSELYAFNVEISCSLQDLVRGTPMSLSDIPLELKSFKTKMMDAIRNLLGVPIAPPDLAPTTTLHNPAPTDIESVECTVGDSVRVPAVDADDVSVGGIVMDYIVGY
ncbi:unnamed protein product [Cuscuta campestris]|uniref:Pectinesterase inhibitor domain-containing protein n=1 Tax=Cuscuta campestris TaxID=132261 RepID=A0A484LXQ0_9ASTE|nr:unnamed protein product [Cuscuta campestris]